MFKQMHHLQYNLVRILYYYIYAFYQLYKDHAYNNIQTLLDILLYNINAQHKWYKI